MGDSIFISYRREDTAGFARALYNALLAHFDTSQIFMDVATIEAGADFVRAIDEAIASSHFMIVLIGRHWLSPRLAKPTDYVRVEIAAALRRNIRVIPVLVDGAEMPKAEDLPNDVALITKRNGLPLNHTQFEADVERLIEEISPQPRNAQPMHSDIMHAPSPVLEVSEPRKVAQLTLQYQYDIEPIWRWVVAIVTLILFFLLGDFIGSVVESATEADNPLPIVIGTAVWIAGVVATLWAWRYGAASALRTWKRWTASPSGED
jgi:hypothetical protein